MANKQIYCPKCGTPNDPNAKFCKKCGTQLLPDTAVQQPSPYKKKKKHTGLIIAFVVLVIALAGGAFYYGSTQANNESNPTTHQREISKLNSENASIRHAKTNTKTDSKTTKNTAKPSSAQALNLTNDQKGTITKDFYIWEEKQVASKGLAINRLYFQHGADDPKDWWTNTPDGRLQIQDLNAPGASAFPLHAIGGYITYTAKNGTTGTDPALNDGPIFSTYETEIDNSKPVTKYVLADNGKLYEATFDSGKSVTPTDGFGQDGFTNAMKTFTATKDGQAQQKLNDIIQLNK